MDQHKTSAEMKAFAKGSLLGNYRIVIGVMILIELIVFFFTMIASQATNQNTTVGQLLYYVIVLIIDLLASVLYVGQISIYFNIASGKLAKVSDIFKGFYSHPDKAIVIQLIRGLIGILCMVPAIIACVFLYINKETFLAIPLALFTVVGISLYLFFSIRYSQAFYLLLDYPQDSATALMSASAKMMKGSYGRLLYLYISYIPLYLLGLLSCGFGFLFIKPYQYMTFLYFYLDLVRNQDTVSVSGDSQSTVSYYI